MAKNVHIVPHMHWDREWYFSTEESRILLINNMEEILTRLETDPDYPYYVLDGQTAILEDFFEIRPDQRDRVKKLVQAGKLIIGPWYTQTDEMVVGGESIVRNLYYGIKDSEEFGEPMQIGYLPDSFGQSAQMPQILNGFDIKYAIFWRGTSERHGTDKTEFYWTSSSGSKVLVQLMPLGYAIGKYLPVEEESLQARMDKYFTVLDRGATGENVLLPNGHDQMPIQQNIYDVIETLKKLYPDREFFLSRYEDLLEKIEKQEGLDEIYGEFLDGKYQRVHRSIYSTRADIKSANTRIENKITKHLEPLAAMAYKLGFEYHHGLIEPIWKEIMKNHAHDSIGCCCSDKVHAEIMARFHNAEERTDRLIDFYKRKIADHVDTHRLEDRLVLFNLLPYEREAVYTTTVTTKFKSFRLVDEKGMELAYEILDQEVIDPGLIDRQIVHYGNYDPFIRYTIQMKPVLPSLGYITYWVEQGENIRKSVDVSQEQAIETDDYRIIVESNGTLTISDKKSGETYNGVLGLENAGDDGDEYDFSPLAGDKVRYSENEVMDAKVEIQSTLNAHFVTIRYEWELPQNLEARKHGGESVVLQAAIRLMVPMSERRMDVSFTINNTAKDHRVRVLIPTHISSAFSFADNQFGTIERSVVDEALAVWESEGWDERPDSIYPFLSYAGLENEEKSVLVMTNSVREYEIIGQNFDTIAVTLFRSIGVLGKEELVRRPGRPSGIKLPTPDSQMLGEWTFDLAIAYLEGNRKDAEAARISSEYTTSFLAYNKLPHDAMKLNKENHSVPASFSLLTAELNGLVLSTLKKAEKQDKLVARFYNPTTIDCSLELKGIALEALEEVNLKEEPLPSHKEKFLKLVPNEVKTITIK
ncbi:mannosylglycerate hydrolase [Peribacillus deserti]|uniref:Mannosylglycerate hydrolase n=1 Tax=Peribacillus deserti TaxID=673318 RepID=A0ABS2QHZ8_9BACI|nr:mannosylglycerate hydrolase [Peribacillus deserti]MBM7692767.1 mannosylglycerate hydrolase [Peribacillus deserti]